MHIFSFHQHIAAKREMHECNILTTISFSIIVLQILMTTAQFHNLLHKILHIQQSGCRYTVLQAWLFSKIAFWRPKIIKWLPHIKYFSQKLIKRHFVQYYMKVWINQWLMTNHHNGIRATMAWHMITKFPEHRCQIYLFTVTVVDGSEAGLDVALIKLSFLSCVNKVALFLCKLVFFQHNFHKKRI